MPRPAGTKIIGLAAIVALAAVEPVPAAAAMAWPALHFSTGVSFNHTLAVGDLNGDGKRDVAVANSQASAVIVLLGNGNGTLASFQSYPTFSEPQDVQMVDLTGDGFLDLATPDYGAGGVTVLRGMGDGTFAPRVGYPVGAGLISLTAADLNGDTFVDLIASKEAGSTIAVLPALPGGGFGTVIEVGSGAIPHQIGAADFNHDGKPDLAVAGNGAAAASVHLGNGTHTPGSATPFAAGPAPIGLTIADLNGDGDADLIVSNVNTATVSVLLGNGNGTFAPPVAYPTDPRPRGMDAGDLDGDGIPEVVIATGYPDGDSALTVYRGVGNGMLDARARFELPYRAADCVLADMNGDGRRDVVATGPQAGVVSVLLNPAGTVGVAPGTIRRDLELTIHPNPVRASATLRFRTHPEAGATLEMFDLTGRRVAQLGPFHGGEHQIAWHGERLDGTSAEPGIYLVRLSSGRATLTRRMVLLPH